MWFREFELCQKPVVLFAAVDASNCFDNKNAFRCAIVTISRFFHIVLFEQTIILPFAVEFNALKKGIKKTLFSVRERDVLWKALHVPIFFFFVLLKHIFDGVTVSRTS